MGNQKNSKWSIYNEEIDKMLESNRSDWSVMAREILGHRDEGDMFRIYIKRRGKRNSVVDETLHRGNLKDNTWKVAWVKDADTGVSALVRNPDFKDESVDYSVIRDDMVEEMKLLSPSVSKYKRKKIKDPHCLVLDIADLHVGKLSTEYGTGKEYNTELAISRAIEGAESLIDKSKPYNIDKVFFIIGNDVLHIDNPKRTTTSGTPQDTDGMWYDNFKVARAVYATIIKKLSRLAEVHVIHCPSNHDYMTGFMLADAVYCYFHNDKNISFDVSQKHRKYAKYGTNLLAFSHGDGCKLDQIPYLTAHEEPALWAETIYRYGFLHHIHHKDVFKFRSGKDFIGMTVEYLRSPSESDRWHSDNGYLGAKVAIEAFIHHPTNGQISRLTHNF
tara:strand:+ start:2640 stop:3803 length:1164 start_codon:yes stop_codon:yes gene_type:complete